MLQPTGLTSSIQSLNLSNTNKIPNTNKMMIMMMIIMTMTIIIIIILTGLEICSIGKSIL